MSLNLNKITASIGIPYQQYVTSSAGHTLISSSTYFNDTSDNIPRYKDASGNIYDAIISSSYALTASHALNAGDDAFPFTGDAQITGSLTISGSFSSFTLDSANVVLGASSGTSMEAGADSNIIVGTNTAASLTTGDFNVILGDSAGTLDTNAQKNVIIGQRAGGNSTGLQENIFIGNAAGRYGSGLLGNVGIGQAALQGTANNNGDYNVGIGWQSGTAIEDGAQNVFVGYRSAEAVTTGNYNVVIGKKSGFTLTTGANNVLVGPDAGNGVSTGNRNIAIGYSASFSGDVSDQLVIGSGSLATISASLATGDIIFASTASAAYFAGDGSQLTNLPASDPFPYTGDAQITGSLEISGSLKMIRPSNKLDLSIGSNIIIGREAGNSISDDRGAIFLGYKAGYTNTSPSSNIAIGYGAGGSLGTNASQQNIFMGYLAGAGNTSIGSITSRMSQASNNIGMGYQALLYLTTGDQNIALGTAVMRNISTGGNNTAFGAYALYNTDSGDNNIGIGYYAGLNQTSGDGNITIGSGSLGVAGESNQLRIGQGNGDALIHGDFASQSLSINGSGSTVFNVIGNQGTLFSVDDDLSGTLFTANDISGLPVLEASASGELYFGKSPQSLYTTAVISSTTANITQSIYGLSTSSYEGVFVDYTATSASNARAGNMTAIWNGSSLNFTETTTTDIGDTSNLIIQVAISQSQAQVQSYSTAASYKIKTIIRSI